MKIGHLSDIHVFALEDYAPHRFLNKRILGATNLLMHRSKSHSPEVLARAIERLEELGADHIAISGDLTNLALEEEFAAVARILDGIEDAPERVSVVPGNHDYYVPSVARERPFERHFAPYLRSDLPSYQLETGYPYCKLLDDRIAFIGLNSGVPSRPGLAIGEVDERELRSLEALLDDPKVRERFTLVMIHHPLLPSNHSKVQYTRRLVNAADVLDVLRWKNVDLAIHGHNHYYHHFELPHLGAPGTLHVCEAGSSSISTARDAMRSGKFNLYDIVDGELLSIETFLFESDAVGFVPWRKVDFTASA